MNTPAETFVQIVIQVVTALTILFFLYAIISLLLIETIKGIKYLTRRIQYGFAERPGRKSRRGAKQTRR